MENKGKGLMLIRALVFDFDGTILDTESADFACWQEIYAEHECSLTLESWSLCIGTTYHSFNPFDHLEEQLGRPVSREEISAEHHRRFLSRVETEQVAAGVRELISEAREAGLKVAVASSSRRDWVTGHLARHGILEQFHCIRTADDVARVKPDPELYLSAVEALGVQPREAVAIEDSPNGARAAKAAGLYCVAVPNPVTCTLPLDHADLKLSCLGGLTLRELEARLATR